jgi:ATP-dependent Zn protease
LSAVVATAYHEPGHAVVGYQLTGDLPNKISVIPKGGSTGTYNCPWPRSFRPEKRLTPLRRQRLWL